jgi:hypothetical protein
MDSQLLGLRVAGAVFGLLCLAQLLRVIVRPDVVVAGHIFPLWPSFVAVVVLALLSLWMWRLARHTLA